MGFFWFTRDARAAASKSGSRVPAVASPRLISAEYPRPHLRGISTSQPRLAGVVLLRAYRRRRQHIRLAGTSRRLAARRSTRPRTSRSRATTSRRNSIARSTCSPRSATSADSTTSTRTSVDPTTTIATTTRRPRMGPTRRRPQRRPTRRRPRRRPARGRPRRPACGLWVVDGLGEGSLGLVVNAEPRSTPRASPGKRRRRGTPVWPHASGHA